MHNSNLLTTSSYAPELITYSSLERLPRSNHFHRFLIFSILIYFYIIYLVFCIGYSKPKNRKYERQHRTHAGRKAYLSWLYDKKAYDCDNKKSDIKQKIYALINWSKCRYYHADIVCHMDTAFCWQYIPMTSLV